MFQDIVRFIKVHHIMYFCDLVEQCNEDCLEYIEEHAELVKAYLDSVREREANAPSPCSLGKAGFYVENGTYDD